MWGPEKAFCIFTVQLKWIAKQILDLRARDSLMFVTSRLFPLPNSSANSYVINCEFSLIYIDSRVQADNWYFAGYRSRGHVHPDWGDPLSADHRHHATSLLGIRLQDSESLLPISEIRIRGWNRYSKFPDQLSARTFCFAFYFGARFVARFVARTW